MPRGISANNTDIFLTQIIHTESNSVRSTYGPYGELGRAKQVGSSECNKYYHNTGHYRVRQLKPCLDENGYLALEWVTVFDKSEGK